MTLQPCFRGICFSVQRVEQFDLPQLTVFDYDFLVPRNGLDGNQSASVG